MDYDIIVIGGGPGGSRASKILAQAGKKTCLITKELGGECLNYGCIPTKAYLWIAELFEKVGLANISGIEVSDVKINWQRMKERKTEIVNKLQKNLAFSLEHAGVKIIKGEAKLKDAHTVIVISDGQNLELKAEYFILATGAEINMPPGFELNDKILSNHGILNLPEIPKNLLIMGGGAVGVEFASIFSTFGAQVTIAERSNGLLSREDPEIGAELEKIFARKNIKVLKNTGITPKQTRDYEKTLVAIGRKPSLSSLNLDVAGVQYNKTEIPTNDFMQTNIPNIFAVGDVAGKALLAYIADREGEIAAKFILGLNPKPLNYDLIPNTIFCIPEIGSVGINENEAKQKNINYVAGKGLFSANSKALILSSRDGFAKIIADKISHKILGIHIIGEKASELISEATLSLMTDMTLETFSQNIYGHPILGEVLKDAADICFAKLAEK